MKKIYTYLALAALLVLAISLKAAISIQKAADMDLAMLQKLNARFIHNFVTNDTASHSQIIHPDFLLITSKGGKVNRKDYLLAWAHGFNATSYYYWDYRDEQISIFGNVALVRSVTTYMKKMDGKEVPVMTRYTDTYIKENGKWTCVQAHLTPVTPENFPHDSTIVRKYINGVEAKR